ncbi:hypothetical protein Gpo141_00002676 [Globisporangium polare]
MALQQQQRHHTPVRRSLIISSSFLLMLMLLPQLTTPAAAVSAVQASDEQYLERTHHLVRLTEQHYRINGQRDDVTLVTSHNEFERDTDEDYKLAGSCATGRFGASEHWKVYFVHLDPDDARLLRTHEDALEPVAVYVNDARNVQTRNAPCAALLEKIRLYLTQEGFDRKTVGVETLVEYRGYVLSSQPASPRWVIINGITIPQAHGGIQDRYDADEEKDHVSSEQLSQNDTRPSRALPAGDAFAFASTLDSLDAVAARDSLPIITEDLRKPYADEFSSSMGDDDLEELQRDHMELLLQDERELLHDDATAVEASWSSAFSLEDWELLRNSTAAQDRRALADGWTSMAKLWLASSGNLSMSVNCLRRAVGWHPGFMPAYLALSSLLVIHVHDPNASCQTMEKMLESVDPGEFRSSGHDMSRVLTTHFPHCSVLIRMASMWETNALFRYVVTFSVVISFLHGVCVALYFFHDRLDVCCCCCRRWWSSHAGPSSSVLERSGGGGSSSRGRRAKRE